MLSKKKAPRTKHKKPRGEQLLDRIDNNPNDQEAWNELAGEAPNDHPASTGWPSQARAWHAYRHTDGGRNREHQPSHPGRGHCPEMFALIQDGRPVPADVGLELLGRLPPAGNKMDLGAFTGRGQGGPCLTDAA